MANNLGNKEIMATNIKYYMDLNNVDRNTICTALNIKYSTFSEWVNARAYPRIDKIELMANYFGISKADLVEPRERNASNISSSLNAVRIPVCGEIAGGVPMDAIEQPIDPNDPDTWEEIPKEWLVGDKEIIALRVHGDSMEPRICDGDVAIIERCYDWHNGAVMAVYVNGDNATLKQVRLQPNGILTLQPFNPSCDAYSYTPEEQASLPVKPLGILKELRAKF